MTKNTKGGKKTKKQRRNWALFEPIDKLEKGQMFGKINQNNGNHFIILCSDNVKRYAPLNNTIKKGPRLHENTFVAVSLREFETNQDNCDILGIARPPGNIIEIFKKIDPGRNHTNDVEFGDSDNEFEEIVENKKSAVISNSICYSNYIDYPPSGSDEYEEDDEEQEIQKIQGLIEKQKLEANAEANVEANVEANAKANANTENSKSNEKNKTNTDKLSSSKQKLVANFMKDDSDEDSDEDSEDIDKL